MVNPTEVGGRYETYRLIMVSPNRCLVSVRTPFAATVAPSRWCWETMNRSHRSRVAPVVWDTANATDGDTGTTR